MAHFVVVGGGIVGTAIARELAKRRIGQVTVLEKERDLGLHASGRNSGVIHSGINQKPGTLKAKMCVKGNELLREYCREHRVPMVECGTLVVARTESELPVLDKLFEMGTQCGVADLRLLTEKELKIREPSSRGIAALLSPRGATVDQHALLKSLAGDAERFGAKYEFDAEVCRIDVMTVLTCQGKRFEADYLINCAGLNADRIAHKMGVGQGLRIIPFRGEYMEVEHSDVRAMIYQVPDLRFPFLSVHLTRETDGRVLAGPTATLAFGREAYDKQWHWKDMQEIFLSSNFWRLLVQRDFLSLCMKNALISVSKRAFWKEIDSLVSGVELSHLSPSRSGIRAQLVDASGKLINDMLVYHSGASTHVLNAVSPGMTSSLAFSEYIVDEILEKTESKFF